MVCRVNDLEFITAGSSQMDIPPAAECDRFSVALYQLSDLVSQVSSFANHNVTNPNIPAHHLDKLILLMTQASISVKLVLDFLQSISNSHSPKFQHFLETPKNVSKRRRKPRASVGSSFEESLKLDSVDDNLSASNELPSDLDTIQDPSSENVDDEHYEKPLKKSDQCLGRGRGRPHRRPELFYPKLLKYIKDVEVRRC